MTQKMINNINAALNNGTVVILEHGGGYTEVELESHADKDGIWLGHEDLIYWEGIYKVITSNTIVEFS